jgi:hypothetical protein
MKQLESLDDVKEYVKNRINDLVDNVINIVSDIHPEVEKVRTAKIEELPPMMGDLRNHAAKELYKHRLSGKTDMLGFDPEPFHDIMMDHSFSYDDYKWIGETDGALSDMGDLANKLGMEEWGKLANSAVYSFD